MPQTLAASNDVSAVVGNTERRADAVFHVTGTWTGTITFEAAALGADASYLPIAVSAIATPGTLVTTTTANGLFKTQNGWAGGLQVRARLSTVGTGAAVVYATTADG